ncbi:response regulator [Paraburkholderia sp. SIMBA_054]|uniref:response regulator n=2 Tax=unclassified Paraburkholderia TaxID=2615204 RepID=UPI00397DE7F6
MHLLLVEDDEMLAEPVVDTMRRAGYVVDWVSGVRNAAISLGGEVYDLIMLDPDLSGTDGFDLLHEYRNRGGRASVIILTARDGVESRIGALDAGVDDYLVKPFDLDELTARVRALMRRKTVQTAEAYAYDGLVMKPVSFGTTLHGEAIDLAPCEFRLLLTLIEEPARVFTRSELEEKVCDLNDEIGSNAIEVSIDALRRKIGAERIVTVRGVGYRLRKIA